MFRRVSAPLLVAALFILALPAHAQVTSAVEPFTVSLSPQYPKPYETVTATVSSTLLDLASSDVTFTIDGTVIAENERSGSFRTKGAGQRSTLRVVVVTDGARNEVTIPVTPTDVALIVDSSTSAHPFYLGGSLVAPEAPVRLVALANFRTTGGAALAPENLVYSWKFGDREMVAESGIGKSTLTATSPTRYRDARVTVTVTTRDKTLVGQATAVVSPVAPLLQIYRNDPLLGIDFANALTGSFVMTDTEEAFRVVPYHFAQTPVLAWTLNDTETGTEQDLTVRTTGTERGTALVGVTAAGQNIFSRAEARLSVEFGRLTNALGF